MLLKKGSLWKSILEKTKYALRVGAQHPLSTEYEFIEDSGIRFFVRVLSNLNRKDAERERREKEYSSSGAQADPFLPYDPDLFVAAVSESHVALLNKFSVVNYHLLIITRGFEDQETLLNKRDFNALCTCMAEYDGLGFYNGGEEAGASQQHKHLQIVPLPLAPEGPSVPLEPLLEKMTFADAVVTTPFLPFQHVFSHFGRTLIDSPNEAAAMMYERYREMLLRVGIKPVTKGADLWQSRPYSLIVTRKWMFLAPRSQEFFDGISINSLGFAGALLVRNAEQMELLKMKGPMTALRDVAIADT